MDNLDTKKCEKKHVLEECIEKLQTIDYNDVKTYINLFCKEEKKLIIEEFKRDFNHIPDDDKYKMETLIFLGKIGIIVY